MITNFNLFETKFYEPIYSVVIHDKEEFTEITRNEKELDKRIRFFDYNDYQWSNNPIYFTLYADEYIVGICKISETTTYDKKKDGAETDYTVVYFSIDRKFRNKKLSRLLMETLFSWLKENNYSISSTSWSVSGRLKLRDMKHELAKEYGVKIIDKNTNHDYDAMYNDDLININEMTPEEYDKFDRNR